MSRQLLQLAALIAITFAAYFPTFGNGFIWDDDRYIEQNAQLRTAGGLERIWVEPLTSEPQYYPLTHTTLWVEYHLWGLHAAGYHFDNVLLHAVSAILLWRILRRLNVGGAWAAAAIFSVYPLQVETVAWATERKNVLSGVFYFLALGAYLRTRWGRRITDSARELLSSSEDPHPSPPPEYQGRGNWEWGRYAASLVLFVAALLSKSVASTLPAVILLLCWWKRGSIRAGDVWPLVPMLVAGLAMGSLTGWMEKHVVGAMGADFDFLTPVDRCCIAGRAFWFYLTKLIWPVRLSFIYPHWRVDPGQRPWLILFSVSAVGILVALWMLRRRIGRGPVTAGLFFAGSLVPALGFVNVFPMRYSYVADHFQYLACVGPIVLGVECVRRIRVAGIYWVFVGVIASCLVASNFRSRVFFDRRSLWTDTLAKNPESAMVHNNYAAALRDAGDIEGAKAQFEQALRLRGDATNWVGLGQCYAIQGDYLTARDMYAKALDAAPMSDEPVFRHFRAGQEFVLATAYSGLATEFPARAAEYSGEAEACYRQAIELFPEYGDARKNLSILLADQKRYPEAIEQCKKMLESDPDSVAAWTNLGMIYFQEGQFDLAREEYDKVLKLEPGNAGVMASVGAILAHQGKLDDAIEILKRAVAIDPNNAIVRRNLAAAMAAKSEGN